MKSKISIIMGSSSDLETVQPALEVLKEFNVDFDVKVLSAHRTPKELEKYVEDATNNGVQVFIGAAGGAAALPGVIASFTNVPVIGVPIESKTLKGIDSLLSIVQMPAGVPVASMAIGSAGAKNAALYALQILSLNDKDIAHKYSEYKKQMKEKVLNTQVKL